MDPNNSYPSSSSIPKILIIAVFIILLFIIGIYFVISKQIKNRTQNTTLDTNSTTNNINTQIKDSFINPSRSPVLSETQANVDAKVGKELIYKQDVEDELLSFTTVSEAEARTSIRSKLMRDSLILQMGQVEGYINLDATFFNSPNKDPKKRLEAVTQVVNKVNDNVSGIKGSVISMWFYNEQDPKIGYEQGKKIALEKITPLHAQVKQGTMTMEQAAAAIKNDGSLANIDTAYVANALFYFDTTVNKRISFSKNFNTIIKSLKEGEVSSIYTEKDVRKDTKEVVDAVYMFGKIEQKQGQGSISSFDEWFNQRKTKYEVTQY